MQPSRDAIEILKVASYRKALRLEAAKPLAIGLLDAELPDVYARLDAAFANLSLNERLDGAFRDEPTDPVLNEVLR